MSTFIHRFAPAWFVAALCAASMPARASQQAALVDELAFFAPLDELALYGHGSTFEFRFRTTRFGDRPDDASPAKVRDGVVRLRFEAAGVWMDEHFVELAAEDAHEPVAHRVRSYYSLATGEYARVLSMAGGGRHDSAIVDHWDGVPNVFFYSLGVLGARAMLADSTLAERLSGDGSIASVSYMSLDGRRWTVTYDAASPGALLSLESHASDDAYTDWVFFEGHRDNVAGMPLRPTLVTHARIQRDGKAGFATVWQSIERTDSAAEDDRWLAAGTRFEDLRSATEETASIATDRPLELPELLTWPGGTFKPYDVDMVELDAAQLDQLVSPRSTGRNVGRTAFVALGLALVGALGWRARRWRSS
jgi:hypothetical protein